MIYAFFQLVFVYLLVAGAIFLDRRETMPAADWEDAFQSLIWGYRFGTDLWTWLRAKYLQLRRKIKEYQESR